MCEKYICARHGVKRLGDIAWGAGYAEASIEFQQALRRITMLGYGLIIIAHAKVIEVQGEEDEESYKEVKPNIPNRAYEIVNQLVDIIGYIGTQYDDEEDNNGKRVLITRATPEIVAGTRFNYLPQVIPFGYEELVKAMATAIEDAHIKDNVELVNEEEERERIIKKRSYSDVAKEGEKLYKAILGNGSEEEQLQNREKIVKIIKKIFGRELRMSEISEDQLDLYELLNLELKQILSE